MPLEISVINMKEDSDNQYIDSDSYDAYTVYVGEHRILTIFTECYYTTTKWFKDVHKTTHRPNNHKHGCLLVGVCADRDPDFSYYHSDKTSYNVLQVCIGSHCYIYGLPYPGEEYCTPKSLQAFFADPKVIAVGMNMRSVAKKLEAEQGIKFANPVELNDLAVKGMKRDELDLGRYDLNRLAIAVLGKQWDVIRPEKPVQWFSRRRSCWWNEKISLGKVEELTVDPFLCYMIGSELLDMMDDKWYPKDFKKFINKKKKYKKKF